MAAHDVEVAERFRVAAEAAVQTGDLGAVFPLLDSDVEWVTPQRTLRGIDEVRQQLTWVSASGAFDFEFSGRTGSTTVTGASSVGCTRSTG
jgi:hypothetical protein